MEEAAKVIGGVTGELLFCVRSFFLGFVIRLCYEPLVIVRKFFRHPWWIINVQDAIFWFAASFIMFGLMFRENDGTPRVFALTGIAAGMVMYHNGPGRITKLLLNIIRKKTEKNVKLKKKRLKRIKKAGMIKSSDKKCSHSKRGGSIGRKRECPQKGKQAMDQVYYGSGAAACSDGCGAGNQAFKAERGTVKGRKVSQ